MDRWRPARKPNVRGFRTFQEEADGPKVRLRPESFADHYSQARLFFISQTEIEQKHIGDALVFELSKCERPDIRVRMVSHLVNIHDDLAGAVANGLGIELPEAAPAAQPTRDDLEPSEALSIVLRGPGRFEGRKLGVLLTDGADAGTFNALAAAIEEEGAMLEVIAPKIAGVMLSDKSAVAGPAEDRWRAFGAVRRGCRSCIRGRRGPSCAGCRREGFRLGCLRALQIHRLQRCRGDPVRQGGDLGRS